MPVDKELLKEKLRAVFTELVIPSDQSNAVIKAAMDIICGRRVEDFNSSLSQTAAIIEDSPLRRLQVRYEKRLREIVLPESGFTTKAQAQEAGRFVTTLKSLQKVQRALNLPVTETPELVRKAKVMVSTYYRRHDKETGEFIPPRRRGRPRRLSKPSVVI